MHRQLEKLSNVTMKVVVKHLEASHRCCGTKRRRSIEKETKINEVKSLRRKTQKCCSRLQMASVKQKEGRKRREMVPEDKEDLCAADNCIVNNEDHENDVDWTECGKCGAWFHQRCVALDTMTKEELENFNFLCVKCE